MCAAKTLLRTCLQYIDRHSKSKPGAMTNTTVKFNVGGTLYEFSKNLLTRFPDSMLANMASDRWNNHEDNDDEDPPAHFVNGNGERFSYILDFVRTGRVFLPRTVAKAALMADADYYGIDLPEDAISQEDELKDAADILRRRTRQFQQQLEENKQQMNLYRKKFKEVELEDAYLRVGHQWYMSYIMANGANSGGQNNDNDNNQENTSDHICFKFVLDKPLPLARGVLLKNLQSVFLFNAPVNKKLFRKVMQPYGLVYDSHDIISRTKSLFEIHVTFRPSSEDDGDDEEEQQPREEQQEADETQRSNEAAETAQNPGEQQQRQRSIRLSNGLRIVFRPGNNEAAS